MPTLTVALSGKLSTAFATLTLPRTSTAQGRMSPIDLTPRSAAFGRPIAMVIGGNLLNLMAVMVRSEKRQVTIVANGGIPPGTSAVVIPSRMDNQVKAEIAGKLVHFKIAPAGTARRAF